MIKCSFTGTIFRDAELRTSKAGKQYLRFSARVGHGDRVQWVGVMVFGDDLSEMAPKLVKGSAAYVEGNLSLDEWTGKDGEKRHGLSVLSSHCQPQ